MVSSTAKLILTATNRENSFSLLVAQAIRKIYKELGEELDILDLRQIPFKDMVEEPFSGQPHSPSLKPYLSQVAQAEGLILVCPEYNGGFPGLIKHFIDHWIYPDSFVYKPVCFIGLGGKFGALTPISHLQAIFLYRHSFVFPIRVFIQNVSQVLKNGTVQDANISQLLHRQAENFIKFTAVLKKQNFN